MRTPGSPDSEALRASVFSLVAPSCSVSTRRLAPDVADDPMPLACRSYSTGHTGCVVVHGFQSSKERDSASSNS